MALILHIETAVESASVCLAMDKRVLSFVKNEKIRDHAAWLHPAIENMMKRTGFELADTDAIAVSIGPGSYTGMRIGLATAKGICYALQKPLIAVHTLQIMANAVKDIAIDLICPMIDARRMEVFTAIYDRNLQTIMEPKAMLLDEKSFEAQLPDHKIIFLGNGTNKFKSICRSPNALFSNADFDAADMVALAARQFAGKNFADPAYTEPLYLKEFYSGPHQPLI